MGELADLAQDESKVEELLEKFRRKQKMNPQSLTPLFAQAEIYRRMGEEDARREVLEEASRRRPDDVYLIRSIADVEERAGEYDKAVVLLQKAIKKDKGVESKRDLAAMYLKYGEVEKGLGLLNQIPAEANDPRRVEKTAFSLVSTQYWDEAVAYLQEMTAKHASDWRLKYLLGICLEKQGEPGKAVAVFQTLLDVENDIKIPKAKANPYFRNYYGGYMPSQKDQVWWQYLHQIRQNIINLRQNMHQAYAWRGGNRPIQLPATPKEARVHSVFQIEQISPKLGEEETKEVLAGLKLGEYPHLDLAILQMKADKSFLDELAKRVEQSPDDLDLAAYWLGNLNKESKFEAGLFWKAVSHLSEKAPSLATNALLTAMSNDWIPVNEVLDHWRKIYDAAPKDEKFAFLIGYDSLLESDGFKDWRKENGGEFARLRGSLLKAVHELEGEGSQYWWVANRASREFEKGDPGEGARLVNLLCRWAEEAEKNPPAGMAMFYRHYTQSLGSHFYGNRGSYRSSSNQRVSLPPFPPAQIKGVPAAVSGAFSWMQQEQNYGSRQNLTARQEEILAELTEQDQDEDEEKRDQKKAVLGVIDEFEKPMLRIIILHTLDEKERLEKEMEKLAGEQHTEGLLALAGYYHRVKKDDVKSYETLVKVRGLPLDRFQRVEVDRHLVALGMNLHHAKKEFDLETAQRAALRMRRDTTMKTATVLTALRGLGLEKEAELLAGKNKGGLLSAAGGSTLGSVPGFVRGSVTSARRDPISNLIARVQSGKKAMAVREAVRTIKQYQMTGHSHYELRQYGETVAQLGLGEEVLKYFEPKGKRGVDRARTYSDVCAAVGREDLALKVFQQLKEEDEQNLALKLEFLSLSDDYQLADDEKLVRREGKFDYLAVKRAMDAFFARSASHQSFESMMKFYEISGRILSELEPSGEKDVNLSWVNYYIVAGLRNNAYNWKVKPLFKNSGSTRKDLSEENMKRLKEVVMALYQEMLRHPQTAEQGFIALQQAREVFEIESDTLTEYAKQAVVSMSQKAKDDGHSYHSSQLWSLYDQGSSSSYGSVEGSVSPITYLSTTDESSMDELLELMKKSWPDKAKKIEAMRGMTHADDKKAREAFAKWEKDLPDMKNEHLRRSEVHAFTNMLSLIQPRKVVWREDFEKVLMTMGEHYINSSNEQMARIQWGKWIYDGYGREEYWKTLELITTKILGKQEKWALYAELGYNNVPYPLNQKVYAFNALAGQLCQNADLCMASAHYYNRYDLEKLYSSLGYYESQLWRKCSGKVENYVRMMKDSGLLDQKYHPKTSKKALLAVARAAKYVRTSSPDFRKEFHELLRKEKGFDPFMTEYFILKQNNAKVEELAKLFEKHFDGIKKRVGGENESMVRAVSTLLGSSGNFANHPKLAKLSEAMESEKKNRARKQVETWLKEGVPFHQHDYNGSQVVSSVSHVLVEDPKTAAKLWALAMKDVKDKPRSTSTSTSGGVRRLEIDRWMDNLVDRFSNNTDTIPQTIEFLHHFYQTPVSDELLPPGKHSSNLHYHVQQYVSRVARKMKLPEKSPESKKPELLLKTLQEHFPKETHDSLAAYLVNGLQNQYGIFKEHGREFLKNVPAESELGRSAMGQVFRVHILMQQALNNPDEAEQKKGKLEASRAFAGLLRNEKVATVFKMDLLERIIQSYPVLFDSKESKEAMLEVLTANSKSNRNIAGGHWTRLLTYMVRLDFEGQEEMATKLAKLTHETFNNPRVTATIATPSSTHTKYLTRLAGLGNDSELVEKMIGRKMSTFRGDLRMLVTMLNLDKDKVALRLVAPPGYRYKYDSKLRYSKELEARFEEFAKTIPTKNRFRFRVAVANLADATNEDAKPVKDRETRLKELAKEFATLKLGRPDDRREVLGVLSQMKEATPDVIKASRDYLGEMTWGVAIISSSQSSSRNSLTNLMKKVVADDLKNKNYAAVLPHMKSLNQLAAGENYNYYAANAGEWFADEVGGKLLVELVKDPKLAEELLPVAEQFLIGGTRFINREQTDGQKCIGLAFCIYASAGKMEEFGKIIEGLSKKDQVGHNTAKRDAYRYCLNRVKYGKWMEETEARGILLQKLLNDPWISKNVIDHMTVLSSWMDSGFFKKEDLYEQVQKLPEAHKRKAEFTTEIAGIKGWREKNDKEAEKWYEEAYQLAKKQKNEVAVQQNLMYRAAMLHELKRGSESWTWAKQINPEILCEKDRAWYDRDLEKWKENHNKEPKKEEKKNEK